MSTGTLLINANAFLRLTSKNLQLEVYIECTLVMGCTVIQRLYIFYDDMTKTFELSTCMSDNNGNIWNMKIRSWKAEKCDAWQWNRLLKKEVDKNDWMLSRTTYLDISRFSFFSVFRTEIPIFVNKSSSFVIFRKFDYAPVTLLCMLAEFICLSANLAQDLRLQRNINSPSYNVSSMFWKWTYIILMYYYNIPTVSRLSTDSEF